MKRNDAMRMIIRVEGVLRAEVALSAAIKETARAEVSEGAST